MDAIARLVEVNADLGARIAVERGWRGELALIHGRRRHPSGFSQGFVDFCKANGLEGASFLRPGRAGFGGFTDGPVKSDKPAIVLVHGNGCDATSMAPLISELMRQGYGPQDIYALSYGKGDPNRVGDETHAPEYAQDIRKFLEVVQKYTKRPLAVVGHSKGVTDAQLAIHGMSIDPSGYVSRFARKLPVSMFVGCAGANQGLPECETFPFMPVSNRFNGFHPEAKLFGILPRLGKVADVVFSMRARNDELLGDDQKTSHIPYEDGSIDLASGGHMGPIWEPGPLVALLKGDRSRISWQLNRSSNSDTDRWDDGLALSKTVAQAFVRGANELAQASFAAGRGDGGASLMHASCGVATLMHAMQSAMTIWPTLPLYYALGSVTNEREKKAIGGE